MNLCMHMAFRQATVDGVLPEDAHILFVGAGTGLELEFLAETFPQWRFTAVDPAPPMLAICRAKAKAGGYMDRCSFLEGTMETFMEERGGASSTTSPFDAATCILVSHFLVEESKRRQLFGHIAACLKPGGQLLVSDLAGVENVKDGTGDAMSEQLLFKIWMTSIQYAFENQEQVQDYESSLKEKIALLPPSKVASLISTAGFETPTLVFQHLLIHTWLATKSNR